MCKKCDHCNEEKSDVSSFVTKDASSGLYSVYMDLCSDCAEIYDIAHGSIVSATFNK